jgi:hypothetical protein
MRPTTRHLPQCFLRDEVEVQLEASYTAWWSTPTDATGSCRTRLRRVCSAISSSPAFISPIRVFSPTENVSIEKNVLFCDVVRGAGSSSPCTDMNVSMKLDVSRTAGGSAYVGLETDDSSGSDELKRRWPTGGGMCGVS